VQTKKANGRIPAFGLEPKFAEQISIGALPLWQPRCFTSQNKAAEPVTPTTWKNPFSRPFDGSNPPEKSYAGDS